jgi:hypothetical protein
MNQLNYERRKTPRKSSLRFAGSFVGGFVGVVAAMVVGRLAFTPYLNSTAGFWIFCPVMMLLAKFIRFPGVFGIAVLLLGTFLEWFLVGVLVDFLRARRRAS